MKRVGSASRWVDADDRVEEVLGATHLDAHCHALHDLSGVRADHVAPHNALGLGVDDELHQSATLHAHCDAAADRLARETKLECMIRARQIMAEGGRW